MPNPCENVEVVTYADDITILTSGSQSNQCLKNRHLKVSLEDKPVATLLISWSAEINNETKVDIGGYRLKTSKYSKYLVVIFDNKFTFGTNTSYVHDEFSPEITSLKTCLYQMGLS